MTNISAISTKHPKGLYPLFFTEMWERFGYYLMLGILFLYMIDGTNGGLGFTDGNANDVYGTYIALVYLTPFVGGLLADRVFGYRKTIVFGGFLMALGYLTLSQPGETAFYTALGLIIVGNGFFKPNISTLLGNLYNKDQYKHLKDKGYNIFYMGINIGSFFCNFIAAWLRNEYGWGYAFAAAGIGMIIGLITFAANYKLYDEFDVVKPSTAEDLTLTQIFATIFLPAIGFAFIGYFSAAWLNTTPFFGSQTSDAFLFACVPVIYFYLQTYLKAKDGEKRALGTLLYIYLVVVIFWAIFHQNGNVLTSWAENNTTRDMPASLVNVSDQVGMVQKVTNADGSVSNLISTELFQSINPFFVVLLTPLVIALFTWLASRKREPSTAAKIAWGLFITGLSTLVMIAAVYSSNNGEIKTSAMWLVGTYAVITIGELFLSPMGLSLVSKLSPPRLTALMMGGWFLSTSIGNKFAGILGHLGSGNTDKSIVFWINFGGATLSALLLFVMLKRFNAIIKERTGGL